MSETAKMTPEHIAILRGEADRQNISIGGTTRWRHLQEAADFIQSYLAASSVETTPTIITDQMVDDFHGAYINAKMGGKSVKEAERFALGVALQGNIVDAKLAVLDDRNAHNDRVVESALASPSSSVETPAAPTEAHPTPTAGTRPEGAR